MVDFLCDLSDATELPGLYTKILKNNECRYCILGNLTGTRREKR